MGNKKHLLVIAQDCYKTFDNDIFIHNNVEKFGVDTICKMGFSDSAFSLTVQEAKERAEKLVDYALLAGITHIVCHCDFALALQIYQYASCVVPMETENFVTRMLDNDGSFFMSVGEDKPNVVLPIKCVQASIDQSGKIELFEVM